MVPSGREAKQLTPSCDQFPVGVFIRALVKFMAVARNNDSKVCTALRGLGEHLLLAVDIIFRLGTSSDEEVMVGTASYSDVTLLLTKSADYLKGTNGRVRMITGPSR